MQYELVKQLEDAGFIVKSGTEFISKNGNPTFIPTLEELIDACGDKLWLIGQDTNRNWFVDAPNISTKGKTPTEAVAKLWLEINTK